MATPTSNAAFTFGVEMELLLKPKSKLKPRLAEYGFDDTVQPGKGNTNEPAKMKNQGALLRVIALLLTAAGVAAEVTDSGSEYVVWNVRREPSLDEVKDERGGGYCKCL